MEISEQSRQYEIKHSGNFDIVVNTASSQRGSVEQALNLVEESIRDHPDDPTSAWQKTGRWNTRLGRSKAGQQFLLKQKRVSMTDYQLEEIHEFHKTGVAEHFTPSEIRRLHYYDSLLNEFALWKRIEAIVGTEEVQRVARKHGFAGIDLVEPLVGFVDRKSKMKCVVYEFIPGEVGVMVDDTDQGFDLTDELKEILKRVGIEPNDLHFKQFITTGNGQQRWIHLIDIEGYIETNRAHVSSAASGPSGRPLGQQ